MTVYVINMDRDRARMEAFEFHNGAIVDISRFPAFDGRSLDRRQLEREGFMSGGLGYTDGAVGCAYSHVALWRRAIETGETVTIAEDDAVFSPSFPSESQRLMATKEWDVIMWGVNFDAFVWTEIPEGVARAKLQFDQGDLRRNIQVFRKSTQNAALIPLKHSFGIMAYTLTPLAARRMLEICLPLRSEYISFLGYDVVIPNAGIDSVMNKAYPSLRCYLAMPPLVVSENDHASSSTI